MNVNPLPQKSEYSASDGTATRAHIQLLDDLRDTALTLWVGGPTTGLPKDPVLYQEYFDTTLNGLYYCSVLRSGATPAVWTAIGGGGGGGVTNVSGVAPIHVINGTTTPVVSHDASGVTPGTYGDATHVAVPTVDAKGHITGITTAAITGGSGTVTSVGLTMPSGYSVTGSPVTGSGTLAVTGPLTTKGDLLGFDTINDRIPIGTDATVLTADSTQTLGLKWAPVSAGGTLHGQEFTASGTFTPPANVSGLWITQIGGGGAGGGTTAAGTAGCGGGTGEFMQGTPTICVPGVGIAVTIGAGGVAVSGAAGGAGGDTSFGTLLTAKGGGGGAANAGVPGNGGGVKGAVGIANSIGILGAIEASTYFGGSSGGAGGNSTATAGKAGIGAPSFSVGPAGGAIAATQAGGGAGSNSPYGLGAAGPAGGVAGNSAASTSYGASGSGAGGHATALAGGNGAGGYCLVQWIS